MRQNQSLKQEQISFSENHEMFIKKGEALHSQAIYDVFSSLFGRLFHKEDLDVRGRRSQAPMRERVSH